MRPTTLRSYKERLLRVLLYIQQHLDEKLGLVDLAQQACLSPYHFHRVFRGMLGESLMSHIRRLRLERAAHRLKLGDSPVIQIAFDAGYETHEAFTRAFHAAFGMSPKSYRAFKRTVPPPRVSSGVHYRHPQPLRGFRAARARDGVRTVTIQRLEPMRVAFMRHVGPYGEVGATWDQLLVWLGKEGWLGGQTQFIGVCYDDPEVTPPDKVRYDACVTVDAQAIPGGDLGVQVLPGGDYAVFTHVGPYDQLGRSYHQVLGQWLPRSGRESRSAPCFEFYLNSPENTAAEDLVTDLYVPLMPLPRRGSC